MGKILRKLLAFLRRDLLIATSYRLAWGLDMAEVVLTVATFFFLGRLVSEKPPVSLAPYPDYFSFVLLGIAVSNYFFISLNRVAQLLRESQLNGTLEVLLVTRTSSFGIFLYSYLAILIAHLVRWVGYILVATLAFHLSLGRANWGAAVVFFALGMGLFLGLGLLSASYILAFKKADPLNWVLTTVSWLISGTLFPVQVLPHWLGFLSQLFPLTPLIAGIRKTLLLGAGVGEIKAEALSLLFFAFVTLIGGYAVFQRALRRALCEGSLGHY